MPKLRNRPAMRLASLIFGFKDSVGPGGVGLGEVGQELRLPSVQCPSWTSDFVNGAVAGGGYYRLRAAGVAESVAPHRGRRRNGWGAAALSDVPCLLATTSITRWFTLVRCARR